MPSEFGVEHMRHFWRFLPVVMIRATLLSWHGEPLFNRSARQEKCALYNWICFFSTNISVVDSEGTLVDSEGTLVDVEGTLLMSKARFSIPKPLLRGKMLAPYLVPASEPL